MELSRVAVLPGLGAADHRPHELHAPELVWAEKNCYADLWIELLHALKLDPTACLGNVVNLDFEGDQWTFFKPPLADLRVLYGIDVQELTVWRPVLDHAVEHLGAGKWLAVEVDSFWLPDTAATDYRRAHGKTTIVMNEVDSAARRLGYFHNAGYFLLEGEDFDGLFAPARLPPYAELIRIDRRFELATDELRERSRALFRAHLSFRPAGNPVRRFADRFDGDLAALRQDDGLSRFHRWAFAGLRQWGAGSELAARYLRWAFEDKAPADAIEGFQGMAQQAKTLLMKAARSVNSGRPLDARETLEAMALAWDRTGAISR